MTAMLILDPGRIDRRSGPLRRLRVGIALVLAASTMYATVALVNALVVGSGAIVDSPGRAIQDGRTGVDRTHDHVHLRVLGARHWWTRRAGAHARTPRPDLAFPQDLTPTVVRPDWRPMFLDYVYLGLTNNLALSPTDVMPLTHWARLVMGLQSIASVLIVGLVIARAVNIFR
jgi:hypothetical protein